MRKTGTGWGDMPGLEYWRDPGSFFKEAAVTPSFSGLARAHGAYSLTPRGVFMHQSSFIRVPNF